MNLFVGTVDPVGSTVEELCFFPEGRTPQNNCLICMLQLIRIAEQLFDLLGTIGHKLWKYLFAYLHQISLFVQTDSKWQKYCRKFLLCH